MKKPLMLLLHGFDLMLLFGYSTYIPVMSQLKGAQYSGKNMGFEVGETSGSRPDSAIY